MTIFRAVLIGAWAVIMAITVNALTTRGLADGKVFFADFSHVWRAQINSDFGIHILLAMAWISYREKTFPRVLLAIPALLGSVYLLPYIFIATFTSKGRFDALLLGAGTPYSEID